MQSKPAQTACNVLLAMRTMGLQILDIKDQCAASKDGYCRCIKRSMHCIWSLHKNVPCVLHFTRLGFTKFYLGIKKICRRETLEFDEWLENLNKDTEALASRLHDKVKERQGI